MDIDIKFLERMIEAHSVTPNDAGCKQIIGQFLDLTPKDYSKNETSNYYFETENDGPLLLFLGHTDVVPPGALSQWHTSPFTLSDQQDQLFARGLVDMKGAIWAFAHVMKYAKPNLLRLGMLLTSDEEGSAIDGIPAMAHLLRQDGIAPDWLLVGEPTSEERIGDTYKSARRGSAHFELCLTGIQGHTAYPQKADNPIRKLPRLLEIVTHLNTTLKGCDLSIYHIGANSAAENMIPQNLTVKINLRYLKDQDYHAVHKALHASDHQLKARISAKPYQSQNNDFEKIIKSISLEVLGYQAQPSIQGGTSDGRWFEKICPNILEYGLKNFSAHQCNETCHKNDLTTLITLYSTLVKKVDASIKLEEIF
ncbi:succinyl-diaminopimelate desuccinylase [Gammaproteobacteria bacterium]|nr:succinyl-diaminopimelate desuccinylase [Gammaproteobacteria bacterium]